MEEFKDKFIADAIELLENLEKGLLELESNPDNTEIIEEIFRGLHTLKGASAMYGFFKIGELIHLFENVYECVRADKCKVSSKVVDLSFQVVDFTTNHLKLGEDVSDSSIAEFMQIEDKISELLQGRKQEKKEKETDITDNELDKTYYIRFSTDKEFESRGVSIKSIFYELDTIGSLITIPIKKKGETKKDWEIFFVSKVPVEEVEDAFFFMLDIVSIEVLATHNLFLNKEFNSYVQKNAVLKKPNNIEELKAIIDIKENEEKAVDIEKKEKAESKKTGGVDYLKVPSEKLDELMDLLSELVTAKAELGMAIKKERYKKLFKMIESVDKITNRFRKNILNIRLIQIKSLYVTFLRLVRDISKQLDKKIEFVAEGLETELDKKLIESLESPLTHLIRNCIDHGIETEEEREKAGKPVKGKISFNTFRSGSDIIIEIVDDGRGIDKEKIRRKAIEKGLINSDTELSDKQLYDLIFVPGFSTAQGLSNISGRGVGMDVVKKNIGQLRGSVNIFSESGKGTTFRIKLPVSLSIIDTLLVQSGKQYFAIPLLTVSKCTILRETDLQKTINHQLEVDDELVPYINLREVFAINGVVPRSQRSVIVTNGFHDVGIVVDKVIGEYQAVLKPFDGYLINQQYYTGASMLADGQLAVILDTNKLIENSEQLTKKQAI